MKKFALIALVSTAFAALPPLAQSTRELQSVLSDSRLYESLGSAEQIQEIIRTEGGYLVLTQNYAMRVNVRYDKGEQKWAGPVQYHLEFMEPISLKNS